MKCPKCGKEREPCYNYYSNNGGVQKIKTGYEECVNSKCSEYLKKVEEEEE